MKPERANEIAFMILTQLYKGATFLEIIPVFNEALSKAGLSPEEARKFNWFYLEQVQSGREAVEGQQLLDLR